MGYSFRPGELGRTWLLIHDVWGLSVCYHLIKYYFDFAEWTGLHGKKKSEDSHPEHLILNLY